MKQLAIVAPQFVPCSYPPAHRVRLFANHLREFGWNPAVLCVDHAYMEEPADPDFCQMVPRWLETIKVKALSPRWTRRLGIGDLGIRCYPYMLRRTRKLCRERRIDCLLIPGPPWHTFLVGPRIKREFGIPYVLDYIDPWVSSWGEGASWFSKAFWYRQMARLLEPRAVRHADHIVAVSDGTNDGVRARYPAIPAERFTGIPYGGEPGDFESLRQHPRGNPFWDREDGMFHLVYVGAMLPRAYDTLRALFQACIELRRDEPTLYSRLRLHFFGTTYNPQPSRGLVLPVAEEMGLADVVSEHPRRVPYLDAMNLLCQADAILGLGTTEKHYTASKIFPCILARRPLLAMYHEASTVVGFVRQAGLGDVITYTDESPVSSLVPAIRVRLAELVGRRRAEMPRLDLGAFGGLTAQAMTARLAAVLDQSVGGAACS